MVLQSSVSPNGVSCCPSSGLIELSLHLLGEGPAGRHGAADELFGDLFGEGAAGTLHSLGRHQHAICNERMGSWSHTTSQDGKDHESNPWSHTAPPKPYVGQEPQCSLVSGGLGQCPLPWGAVPCLPPFGAEPFPNPHLTPDAA